MTNGIVVCIKNGKVILKVVVGCEGHDKTGVDIALALRARNIDDADLAYALVDKQYTYGCQDCRVVISESEIRYDGDDDVSPGYRETFNAVAVNPRYVLPHQQPFSVVVSDYDNGVTYIQSPREGRVSVADWLNGKEI